MFNLWLNVNLFMKHGAGILLINSSYNEVLLALRNEPEHVWGNFGGLVEEPETFLQCAKRETLEETGFLEGVHYKLEYQEPIDISEYINFAYHCFLGTVLRDIKPKLNYEHSVAKWFLLNKLPHDLHFGVKKILLSPEVIKKIESCKK